MSDVPSGGGAPAPSQPGVGGSAEQNAETAKAELAVEAAPKKYKVKVDKEEVEVDEGELLKGYQKGKAADKRMHEAAQVRKQAEEFISMLKKDPVSVLKKLGPDARKAAEEFLYNELQYEGMSAEQKELHQLREEAKERKRKEEEAAQERESQETNKKAEALRQELTKKFQETLETAGLPKTNHTIARMAYFIREGAKRGESLDPADVVEEVREEYMEAAKTFFGGDDGETLEKFLPDLATKLRQRDLAKLKSPVKTTPEAKTPPKSAKKEAANKKTMTKAEWRKFIDS